MAIDLLQEARFGLRRLVKSPGFTLAAVLSLALGIGANSAIFSVINGILVRPLPYKDPERLVALWQQAPGAGVMTIPLADVEYFHLREQKALFEDMAIYLDAEMNLTGVDQAERIGVTFSSASLFPVLGVQTQLGRVYTPEEDRPGQDQVAVLSNDLWRRRFASDPNVVGKTVQLNGLAFEIVGVMPPGFHFPSPKTAVWLPAGLDAGSVNPSNHNLSGVGRLARGMTVERCEAASKIVFASEIYKDLIPAAELRRLDLGLKVVPLFDYIVGDVRSVLLMLFGAVGFVLLIACANVANLLLARAEARRRELAVRNALGADRTRLLWQFLSESALLGVAGTAVGLLFSFLAVKLLLALGPAGVPRLQEVGLDLRTLLFTLAVGLLTILVFGLVPALQTFRLDPQATLGETRPGGGERHRLGRLLVVSEVALAAVLLIGAGLFLRSLWLLGRVDPGFDPQGVLTSGLALPRAQFAERQDVNSFYTRLLERVSALPGVRSAALVNVLPLGGLDAEAAFDIEGRPPVPGDDALRNSHFRVVTPGYFATMRIPLRKGRAFAPADDDRGAPVAVVDETMARTFWPGQDAIGKRIRVPGENSAWRSIVGVVKAVRHDSLHGDPVPTLYLPHAQMVFSPDLGGWRSMVLAIRSSSDPEQLGPSLHQTVRALDRNLPLSNVATMEQVVTRSVAQPRFTTLLLAVFAGLALFLAALGIYGVLSYITLRRTRELGIRVALGARRSDILWLVMWRGLGLTVAGLAVGLGLAVLLRRLVETLLFGVRWTDPVTLGSVCVVLLAVAMVAVAVPAWRAARAHPTESLRFE
ncbi:MAG TPA: ABC transporter permease [Thermoanaerobaculia bacterium]|nr:ABC transporter permease [Thermoanaerobaculia bacterium]